MTPREILMAQTGRRYATEHVTLSDGSTYPFRLRSLTTKERADYMSSRHDKRGKPKKLEDIQARLVQLTLVDDSGNLVLDPLDREALLGLDGAVVGQLYEAAFELCRLAPKWVDEEAGNSDETGADATNTES